MSDEKLDTPPHLLTHLQAVQDRQGYVPLDQVNAIAREAGVPPTQVQGLVEFHHLLSSSPRGQYQVLFSDCLVDQHAGMSRLKDRLAGKLGVTADMTRSDGRVSIGETSCTGMCDQGPAVLINGQPITQLTAERIDRVADLIERGVPLDLWPPDLSQVDENVRRKGLLLSDSFQPGSALGLMLERGPDAVLAQIASSGLRGRGGAGFKTSVKWDSCRQASGTHWVVCNADEGEPGTFKDRELLHAHLDLVVEGMSVCAGVIGAHHGVIYIRGEYRYLLSELEAVLARRRAAGLLGPNILGTAFSFDVELFLGAGAYICGEESALLESLEGKRGVPRIRPPFPVTHGYEGQPTVVNNVETFAVAALVAVRGGDWYAAAGTEQSRGTKLLSVSGDCARPGIYEYPFGITVREVLADCGATDVQAIQVGGPSGACIGEDQFDRKLAFEDLATGGAFMVFNRDRDMVEVARGFSRFFANESCGFCTPCRVGTTLMSNLLDKLCAGRGTPKDIGELESLGHLVKRASHCGLGQTAGNPVLDTLARFPDAYSRRLKLTGDDAGFDLERALEQAHDIAGQTTRP